MRNIRDKKERWNIRKKREEENEWCNKNGKESKEENNKNKTEFYKKKKERKNLKYRKKKGEKKKDIDCDRKWKLDMEDTEREENQENWNENCICIKMASLFIYLISNLDSSI